MQQSTMTVAFMMVVVLVCAVAVAPVRGQVGPNGEYFLGPQGINCDEACAMHSRTCSPFINTGNTTTLFTDLDVDCKFDSEPWWATNQPCFVSGSSDPNFGKCLGYIDVPPTGVNCSGAFPTVQRVCRCVESTSSVGAFGTGLSGGMIYAKETELFAHVVAAGSVGVMTHFWYA